MIRSYKTYLSPSNALALHQSRLKQQPETPPTRFFSDAAHMFSQIKGSESPCTMAGVFNRANYSDICFAFDSSWPCPRPSLSCPGSCTCWRKSWRKKRCVERHVRLPEPPHPPSRSRWWGKYLREFLFIWASVFVERAWDDILQRLCVYALLKHHCCYCPYSVTFLKDFCLRDKNRKKYLIELHCDLASNKNKQ